MAVFFIFMTLSSGSFRALFVVRRNQIKIQKLATFQKDVLVLRRHAQIKERPTYSGQEIQNLRASFNELPSNIGSNTMDSSIPAAASSGSRLQVGGSVNSSTGSWMESDGGLIYPGDIFVVDNGIVPVEEKFHQETFPVFSEMREKKQNSKP